jgi:hypothetical protein
MPHGANTQFFFIHAVKSHTKGRSAHHSGCNEIARTPRRLNRYPTSCSRGSAVRTSPPPPLQNTSADAAARGHTIGSRFSGPDCSVHRSCCPPSTSAASAVLRFAVGSKVYACVARASVCGENGRECGIRTFCHVLKGSHQLLPVGSSPDHPPAPQSYPTQGRTR